MDQVDPDFGQKSADFALNLFRRAGAADADALLSPASLAAALAMAYLGAGGETKLQMRRTVFADLDDQVIRKNTAALHRLMTEAPKAGRGYTLTAANRMFVDLDFVLRPDFTVAMRDLYSSDWSTVDFKNAAPQAVAHINEWAAEKTGDKIRQLFDELDSEVRLVLANAVYFKGDWRLKFDPALTRPKPFYASPSVTRTLETMSLPGSRKAFGFNWRDDRCLLLDMPYRGDDRVSLVVLLPKERFGLAALERDLTGQQLWGLIDGARNIDVEVELPKFKVESSVDVMTCLKSMGVVDMFSPGANFSMLTDADGMRVSAIRHKVFLEVNEEGSEAAAVTAVVDGARCLAAQPEAFIADHPFLFAIVEKRSKTLLFLGHFYG